MVSASYRPKDGCGGDGQSTTLHSSSEEKKKEGREKRYQCLNITCLWWALRLTWGFPPKAFQHSNLKHMVEMGVGKKTRVIIGTVGVIESCGSTVCVYGVSSRSAVSCESLWRVYRRISTPLLTHELFVVAVVQARRMDLTCFSSACCFCLHAWYRGSSSSLSSYCAQMAKLTSRGRGNPNQKAQAIHFLWGGKNVHQQKIFVKNEKCSFQKTSVCVSSCCAGWVWLTARNLRVPLTFGFCHTGKVGRESLRWQSANKQETWSKTPRCWVKRVSFKHSASSYDFPRSAVCMCETKSNLHQKSTWPAWST